MRNVELCRYKGDRRKCTGTEGPTPQAEIKLSRSVTNFHEIDGKARKIKKLW